MVSGPRGGDLMQVLGTQLVVGDAQCLTVHDGQVLEGCHRFLQGSR